MLLLLTAIPKRFRVITFDYCLIYVSNRTKEANQIMTIMFWELPAVIFTRVGILYEGDLYTILKLSVTFNVYFKKSKLNCSIMVALHNFKPCFRQLNFVCEKNLWIR